MINIFRRYHLIKNLPNGYPVYKRLTDNVIFFLTRIILHPRKSQLTHKDLLKATMTLKKGDIILVGNLRTAFHLLVTEPVTHSGFYVGNRRFIHSMADGVSYISLYKIFRDYDTLAILRMPEKIKKQDKIIEKAIEYATSQYGKPYDFDFRKGPQAFFCTELVNESFLAAGYNTKLTSVKRPKKVIKKMQTYFTGSVDALHPINFLKSNFKVVYTSHNLECKKGTLRYIKD